MKESMSARHKQKIIYVQSEGRRKRIICDEGVAPLVKKLWKEGYKTEYSCQGDSLEMPYITLIDIEDSAGPHKILTEYWGCDVETRKFKTGFAYYALPTKKFRKLWDKIHSEKV